MDANSQWNYAVDSKLDSTYGIADDNVSSLSSFFARPVRIRSYSWPVGSSLAVIFNPWTEFFSNARVENRIVNYQLMRCKLKVKIVINGNSFFYGRALASYRPLHTRDQFGTSRVTANLDMIQESQRPHIFLNPTQGSGGELELPFLWYNNALKIPTKEWEEMGEMVIRSFSTLKHANGAEEPVTINVFAWAEDMHLSVPTANQPGALTPQAGPADGPVSGPAMAVAKAAEGMAKVPAISSYAMAASTVAKGVGKMASAFGYTKPVSCEGQKEYVPSPFPNSVNVDGNDTTTKLTFDSKQAVTIDPAAVGLGSTDEMTVLSIAQRESYLVSINWPTDLAPESQLWRSHVTPSLWNSAPDPLTGKIEIHMPACCYAVAPFRHWRGTINYRFQIVSSAYHKGRIRLSYDPSFQLTNEYNTNINRVIDISEENDFTVSIGWGSAKPMLEHAPPSEGSVPYGNVVLSDIGDLANGMLSMYVVNELTTPNSVVNNSIIINVFVSAGPDFEVFNPTSGALDSFTWFPPGGSAQLVAQDQRPAITDAERMPPPASVLKPVPEEKQTLEDPPVSEELPMTPQAGLPHPDAMDTDELDAPNQEQSAQMATITSPNGLNCIYFGDPIVSFRQCLKRYSYSRSYSFDNTTRSWHQWFLPTYPFYRGTAPGAIDTATGAIGYNYNKMTLMNYLIPGYVCKRGSVRWRYFHDRMQNVTGNLGIIARRASDGSSYSYTNSLVADASQSLSQKVRDAYIKMPNTWSGVVVQCMALNPVLSAEMPFYSQYRFLPARVANVGASTNFNVGAFGNLFHAIYITSGNTGVGFVANRLDSYCAAGDDFSLHMFIGAPRIFILPRNSDPVASG